MSEDVLDALAKYVQIVHAAHEEERVADNLPFYLGHLAMAARYFAAVRLGSSKEDLERFARLDNKYHVQTLGSAASERVEQAWGVFAPVLEGYLGSKSLTGLPPSSPALESDVDPFLMYEKKELLKSWVIEALRSGPSDPAGVARYIWKHHYAELKKMGDTYFTWQYDIRWAANVLRRDGVMEPAPEKGRGYWRLSEAHG